MVSREELYELVWSMPTTNAAKKYSVSGSYLARICSVLRVPRPERGYWAKLDVGKAPPRPALPEALPGDQLSWSQEGDPPAPRVRAITAASEPARQQVRRVVSSTGSSGTRRNRCSIKTLVVSGAKNAQHCRVSSPESFSMLAITDIRRRTQVRTVVAIVTTPHVQSSTRLNAPIRRLEFRLPVLKQLSPSAS